MDIPESLNFLLTLAFGCGFVWLIAAATGENLRKSTRPWNSLITHLKGCAAFSLLALLPRWCYDADARPLDFGSYSLEASLEGVVFLFCITAAGVLIAAWRHRHLFPAPDAALQPRPEAIATGATVRVPSAAALEVAYREAAAREAAIEAASRDWAAHVARIRAELGLAPDDDDWDDDDEEEATIETGERDAAERAAHIRTANVARIRAELGLKPDGDRAREDGTERPPGPGRTNAP